MVDIHLLIQNGKKLPDIDKSKIKETYVSRDTKDKLYILTISEEEFTFYKLKYGSENVWKR